MPFHLVNQTWQPLREHGYTLLLKWSPEMQGIMGKSWSWNQMWRTGGYIFPSCLLTVKTSPHFLSSCEHSDKSSWYIPQCPWGKTVLVLLLKDRWQLNISEGLSQGNSSCFSRIEKVADCVCGWPQRDKRLGCKCRQSGNGHQQCASIHYKVGGKPCFM